MAPGVDQKGTGPRIGKALIWSIDKAAGRGAAKWSDKEKSLIWNAF